MLPDRSEQRPIITLYRLHRPSLREGLRGPGRLGRVIRCRFVFSGKNDELTPDFPLPGRGARNGGGDEPTHWRTTRGTVACPWRGWGEASGGPGGGDWSRRQRHTVTIPTA